MADYTPITNLRGPAARITAVTAAPVAADADLTPILSGPDQNRSIALKIPRGLPGVNALDNDAAVATYLAAPDSETAQLANTLFKRDVSVLDHGAVADGTTDNTTAFQNAALEARTLGLPWTVPLGAGEYKVRGIVEAFTSLDCKGVIKIDAADTAGFKFSRLSEGVPFTYAAVGGLTAGSTRITGLGGRTGTLIITSSEVLIGRITATGSPFYTKTDSVRVINADGDISPTLESTYGSASLMLYPDDPDLTIRGLKVNITGSGTKSILDIYRSNVLVDGGYIANQSTGTLSTAVRVQDASKVNFLNFKASGFFGLDGAGYGVAAFNSSALTWDNCEMVKCRHAITGRHTKDMKVVGGSYEGNIDSHWNNGLVIDGITMVNAENHILISGSDVKIVNNRFLGGRNVLGIRYDTPELAGNLIIEDNYWQPVIGAAQWMVGYSSFSDPGTFDFGRVLKTPTRGSIQRNEIRFVGTAGPVDILNLTGNGYTFPRDYWRSIEIGANRMTNVTTGRGVIESRNDAAHPNAGRCNIKMTDITFPTSYTAVYLDDATNTSAPAAPTAQTPFNLTMTRCENVRLFLPDAAMDQVNYVDCGLAILTRSVTNSAWKGSYRIERCRLVGTQFVGNARYDFISNEISGALASSTITMDGRVKSYMGNRVAIGTTGHPTVADPYRNPAYYL